MSSDHEGHTIEDLIATSNTPCEETALGRVMETVMRMTLKVANATGGRIMLLENGSLRARARAWLQQDVVVQIGASFDDDPLIGSIAHAVAHSGQPVVLNTPSDASQISMSCDPSPRLPCSAFCLPLHRGGRLVAVLYLENDRVENAFTASARSLLDLLAPQIAIVLEDKNDGHAFQSEEQGQDLAASKLRQVGLELSLASRVSAVDMLIASVTHEISQPLSAIDASSSAGLRWLQRDTPNLEEAVVSLEKVRSCAMRARKIIDDLRALNSHSAMSLEDFDIHSAIREVVLLSRPRIEELGASVAFTGMSAPQQVMGDRVQIQEVIENLLVNALEAMANITDRARIIQISSSEADSESLTISVADSGPGISPESEEKMFRPFVTTKPQRLGMGLSICMRIIEAHGGTMWLDTARPFGLRLSFTLERAHHDHGTS